MHQPHKPSTSSRLSPSTGVSSVNNPSHSSRASASPPSNNRASATNRSFERGIFGANMDLSSPSNDSSFRGELLRADTSDLRADRDAILREASVRPSPRASNRGDVDEYPVDERTLAANRHEYDSQPRSWTSGFGDEKRQQPPDWQNAPSRSVPRIPVRGMLGSQYSISTEDVNGPDPYANGRESLFLQDAERELFFQKPDQHRFAPARDSQAGALHTRFLSSRSMERILAERRMYMAGRRSEPTSVASEDLDEANRLRRKKRSTRNAREKNQDAEVKLTKCLKLTCSCFTGFFCVVLLLFFSWLSGKVVNECCGQSTVLCADARDFLRCEVGDEHGGKGSCCATAGNGDAAAPSVFAQRAQLLRHELEKMLATHGDEKLFVVQVEPLKFKLMSADEVERHWERFIDAEVALAESYYRVLGKPGDFRHDPAQSKRIVAEYEKASAFFEERFANGSLSNVMERIRLTHKGNFKKSSESLCDSPRTIDGHYVPGLSRDSGREFQWPLPKGKLERLDRMFEFTRVVAFRGAFWAIALYDVMDSGEVLREMGEVNDAALAEDVISEAEHAANQSVLEADTRDKRSRFV